MNPTYEKISIIVINENSKERQKYFNLFHVMMKDKITRIIDTKDRKEFETDKFYFKFIPKSMSAKGYKAHYVLNLTQDEEYNDCYAVPITSPMYDYLKEDEQWIELFKGMEINK